AQTPSNRGALNGTNATDGGSIQANFTHYKHSRRTVDYGQRIGIGGRPRHSHSPPHRGAPGVLLMKEPPRAAPIVVRKSLTTRSDGSFSYRASASASRLIQFGWRSHVNDIRFAASGYLTLEARASADLHVSTHHPRVGHRITISGRMHGVDRDGVT